MSIPTPVLRAARLAVALLALSLTATALAPAVSSALPTQSGAGESDYCASLLERVKRYHAIAKNPAERQSVRDFYAARASVVLVRARLAGCGWATSMQISGPATLPGTPVASRSSSASGLVGPAARTRHRTTFDRLSVARRDATRAAKRRATGGGTRVPSPQATPTAIKATSTGNAQHDQYCADVAKLIDEAEAAGDNASVSGDDAGADAWWELADYFIDRATQNGCRFTMALSAATNARVPGAAATRG